MPEAVTFRSLTVEGFRGFRDPSTFDLSASVVLISGPNGTGKTSFFDAIQWLLLGDVPRLRALRTRQNEEHLVNQYRAGEPASVEAHVELGGRELRIRRTGTGLRSPGLLEIVLPTGESLLGSEAESYLGSAVSPVPEMTLESALLTSGILQQDSMRALLEAKPAERYEHLRHMLGLDAVEKFEDAAVEARRDAERLVESQEAEVQRATQSVAVARDEAGTIRARLSSRGAASDLQERFSQMIDSTPGFVPTVETTVDAMSRFSAETRAVADELSGALAERDEREREWTSLTKVALDETGIEQLQSEVQVLRARFSQVEAGNRNLTSRLTDLTNRAAAMDTLLSTAVSLLTDVCPVCLRPIDEADLASTLRQRIETGSSAEELQRVRSELDEGRQLLETIRAAGQAQAETLREALLQQERQVAALAAVTRARARVSGIVGAHETFDLADEALAQPGNLVEQLRELSGASRELALVLRADRDIEDLQRADARVAELEAALAEAQARLVTLRSRQTDARRVEEVTRQAAIRVSEARFEKIQPLIADTYLRLDPHPSFKVLAFRHALYRRRGESSPVVRDESLDIEANPLLVFSAAQANIVALSYFLALNWAGGVGSLPFVLLDDPLQSMDDVNVLAFADLARLIRTRQQLIIGTHSRRFAALLERKLASRREGQRSVSIDFLSWSRSGPTVSTREIPSQVADGAIKVLGA